MTWLISLIHIHWILIYPVGSAIQRLIVIVIACLPTKPKEFIWTRLNESVRSRSNWNLEMLVFEERENRSTQRKTSQSKGENHQQNSTHIWRRRRELNPDHIGGRRALSPLRHPCSPEFCNPGLVPIHWFTTTFLLFSLLPFLIL